MRYGDNTKLRSINRTAYDSFLLLSHLSPYSVLRCQATCFDVEGYPAQKEELKSGQQRLVDTLTTQAFWRNQLSLKYVTSYT